MSDTTTRSAARQRRGSEMSTKQIQYAVVAGRRVTFHPGAGLEPVVGYVAGVDDFHWLVVAPTKSPGEVMTTLVHKRSPVVIISKTATLQDESAADLAVIQQIGGSFVENCRQQIKGRSDDTD